MGCEHVTLEALRSLELDHKLKQLGFSGPQVSLAIGAIIGRACHPGSELATHGWLQNQSGLGELIDYDFEQVSLYKMYKISDQLLKKRSAIEKHLFEKERNLFSLQETITLYDLTNTYFEGRSLGNSLGKRGRSKEKRTDCPLVTLALVLDSSGFPIRSHVYEGNVGEAKTLSEMINDLRQQGVAEYHKSTVVMDAGIASQDNIDCYPGVYCLRTNQTDWDETTLWKTYTMLTDLEAVFRSLKSELGLRPIYHQIADRVSGHLFITGVTL